MFKLSDLLKYEDIVIQCHNFPDADAIASGFAVQSYLASHGRAARLIYGGFGRITKPNLTKMLELLNIEIEHVEDLPNAKTLVVVDCQYGEKNIVKFDAEKVFVLDHHEDMGHGHDGIIQSSLGGCSTLIWALMAQEDFDFAAYPDVATALYYGLFTDTNSLEEVAHPLDKDLRDSLKYNQAAIDTMRFNNLTIGELQIAGEALSVCTINSHHGYAIFRAAPCDQNILGFISDLALQVEDVGVVIVYNELPNGYKLSMRSCVRDVMASEFAAFLAGGGGHRQKAGGFISKDKLDGADINDYINARTNEYFESYELVDAANHNINFAEYAKYVKKSIPVSFVKSTEIFAADTPMLIRTLEGDSDALASDDINLMIGLMGEVYPIKAEKFAATYDITNESMPQRDYEYAPTVKNKITGESIALADNARMCIHKGTTNIYAAELTKNTKVFTAWNPNGYMFGKAGDYIAARTDDCNDVYIIQKDIFDKTYESARDGE
ncbi:MAG: DHH family phosphoesterase [Defluviitaleaceae bacterium]|nr:DHH family phosphoesterase [Defluviitaleaceae bacterium]